MTDEKRCPVDVKEQDTGCRCESGCICEGPDSIKELMEVLALVVGVQQVIEALRAGVQPGHENLVHANKLEKLVEDFREGN